MGMVRISAGLTMLCMLLLVACMSVVTSVPPIQTLASEMNLTAADVGNEFTLVLEQGREENRDNIDRQIFRSIDDMNLRGFESSESRVLAAIVSFGHPMAAEGVYHDVSRGFFVGLRAQVQSPEEHLGGLVTEYDTSDLEITFLEALPLGDKSDMVGVSHVEADVEGYSLSFRKVNVIGIVWIVGPKAVVEQTMIEHLGQMMEAKVQ